MDYEKAKQDALDEKEALTRRLEEIDQETARLKDERVLTEHRLAGLKQVLEGLIIMTTEPPPAPLSEPLVVAPAAFATQAKTATKSPSVSH